MEKEQYIAPDIEIIHLENSNVITESICNPYDSSNENAEGSL